MIEKVLTNEKEFSRTTHTYTGDTTTVEPPTGAPAVREKVDARGRLLEKLEYDGNKATGSFSRLAYGYDHADRLTSVKDDDGNAWSYGFDLLGRQTSTSDPDAGASTSEFNDLDQVVATTDARQKSVGFTYDLLGRTTGKLDGKVPVVNGAPAPEDAKYLARWTYDSIAKGQLTSAIRYVGGKTGSVYALTNAKYDKVYRVLNEQYTISKTEGALAYTNGTWTIANAYNLDGTLQKRTIPAMGGFDQEVLKYGYTEQRMPDTLDGLTGIVQNTDYLAVASRSAPRWASPPRRTGRRSTGPTRPEPSGWPARTWSPRPTPAPTRTCTTATTSPATRSRSRTRPPAPPTASASPMTATAG